MFRKLRIRSSRSKDKSLISKSKDGNQGDVSRSVFRKTTSDDDQHQKQPPSSIEPALTFTLSQEEEEDGSEQHGMTSVDHGLLTLNSPKIQQISSYIFTEEQLMENEFNHMRAIAEKQGEIIKLQTVHRELLKALDEKSRELVQVREEVTMKDKELVETYQELTKMDAELHAVQEDLHDTKAKLNDVSKVLMRLQDTVQHSDENRSWFW